MYKIVCLLAIVAHQVAAETTTNTTCNANEIFLKCGPRCPQKCDVRARECQPVGCCDSGCYCKDGYVRYKGVCRDEKKVCCPKNEVFSCGSACQNECAKLGEVCPIQTLVCVENCFCVDGYARDVNGKCIPESKCPPKNEPTCDKANEHYDACAEKFEPSCANRSPNGCGGSKCYSKCVCDRGYVRDQNKRCIKVSECTINNSNEGCNRNEVYQTCGNPCQGTCDNPDLPQVCRAPCRPGCFCKVGYLFNAITSRCVRQSQCPNNATEVCERNSIYQTCGNPCQGTCDKPDLPLVCKAPCRPGCFCKEGYLFNALISTCVKQPQCPNNATEVCERNSIYQTCGNPCQGTCDNPDLPLVCKAPCRPGCFCKEGYLFNALTSRCVKQPQCPNNATEVCERNSVYQTCGNPCQATCDNPDFSQVCKAACRPGCFCKEGYLFNAITSTCVKQHQCPNNATEVCERNSIYQTCGNPCQGTCANPGRPLVCKMACRPGCFCKEGYLLNETTNKCVRESDCSVCKKNESYETCGNPCQGTCANPDLPLICKAPCRPGCFCNEGYLFDDANSKCVKRADCKNI